jgi:succinate dehydrogenase / fumarate reductase, membrane anchor subunit
MTDNNNIAQKCLLISAHYVLRDWLAQRLTAIVMVIYTVILLGFFLTAGSFSYDGWAGLFSHKWFKLVTFVALMSLFFHAWIGVRDIWMDYVKPVGVRLILQVAAILWLLGCAGWAAQILWRV